MKIQIGDTIRTKLIKGSEDLGLVISTHGTCIRITRIPKMHITQMVALSCVEEIVKDSRLEVPPEELLTHEQAWIRLAGKILLKRNCSSA